jgi:hypothetical protein
MKTGAQLAAELIAACDRRGVTLRAFDEFVQVSPSAALTPDLADAIRALRPELVAALGNGVELSRRPWVADVCGTFATIESIGPGWPDGWRAQLRQSRPRLARRLARAEVILDVSVRRTTS